MARPWTKSFEQGCIENKNLVLLNQLNTLLSGLKANEFSWQSNKMMWWACDKGHSWLDFVYNRTGNNTKCPFCAGKRLISGETDLKSTHEELCKDWHPDITKNPIGAENFSKGMHVYVWWKCQKCSHEWVSRIDWRASKGRGCPHCNRGRGTSYPELVVYYWIKDTL